jgi:hypothetical protein
VKVLADFWRKTVWRIFCQGISESEQSLVLAGGGLAGICPPVDFVNLFNGLRSFGGLADWLS